MTSFFNAVAKVLLSILFQKIYFLYMYVIVKYVIWALKKAVVHMKAYELDKFRTDYEIDTDEIPNELHFNTIEELEEFINELRKSCITY